MNFALSFDGFLQMKFFYFYGWGEVLLLFFVGLLKINQPKQELLSPRIDPDYVDFA